MFNNYSVLPYCLEQFSNNRLVQECENGKNIQLLLLLSEKVKEKPGKVEQDRNNKKSESKCESLQPWKVCSDNTSHKIDLLADDVINIQRQLRRSNRIVNDVTGTFGQQNPKGCSQNWISEEKASKSRTQSGNNNQVKIETKKERYCGEFKHCSSPEEHIKSMFSRTPARRRSFSRRRGIVIHE
ncbi:uncharacterized protein LOC135680856 isoform X2 [Rhopilema esculentum]|uniref:uncharacterized protein LOC135680856 isoform X2 n=1 Tax=Rhopilema esculentum TaxID=499914 RepID=UPI0031E2A5FA